MVYCFDHTISDMQVGSNCLDYWCIFWIYLFLFYITDMSSKRSKTEIEQVVVRQDVMDHIFQENNWQSMYTCNRLS